MLSAIFPVKPSDLAPSAGEAVTMVINPAAMPSGTELFVGYFNSAQTLRVDLIYARSHTCSNRQEPPGAPQPRGPAPGHGKDHCAPSG